MRKHTRKARFAKTRVMMILLRKAKIFLFGTHGIPTQEFEQKLHAHPLGFEIALLEAIREMHDEQVIRERKAIRDRQRNHEQDPLHKLLEDR